MDDIFRSYILPAVIAAVVALVSFLRQSLYTKQQSRERIRWIQELRNAFSDFRPHTAEVAFKCNRDGRMGEDYSYEINREATYLKLLLKGYGHKEQKIKGYIDETISSLAQIGTDESSLAPYFSAMEELTKQIQIYLKIEWERVKEEVNGETWDNVKERKWEQKLISMYEE